MIRHIDPKGLSHAPTMTRWRFKPRLTFPLLTLLLLVNSLLMPPGITSRISAVPHNLFEGITNQPSHYLHLFSLTVRPGHDEGAIADLETVRDDRNRLWQLNQQLRQRLQMAHDQIRQLTRMHHRLPLDRTTRLLPVPVARVRLDPQSPKLYLARGRLRGLQMGQAVGRGINLIGRVRHVGPASATVDLITTPRTHLDVQIVPVDEAPRELDMQMSYEASAQGFVGVIDTAQQELVRINDLAILSDQRWPVEAWGFVVGRVVKIEKYEKNPLLLRRVIVRPRIDLEKLSHVTVVAPGGISE